MISGALLAPGKRYSIIDAHVVVVVQATELAIDEDEKAVAETELACVELFTRLEGATMLNAALSCVPTVPL
jgi:hypothetical protein